MSMNYFWTFELDSLTTLGVIDIRRCFVTVTLRLGCTVGSIPGTGLHSVTGAQTTGIPAAVKPSVAHYQ